MFSFTINNNILNFYSIDEWKELLYNQEKVIYAGSVYNISPEILKKITKVDSNDKSSFYHSYSYNDLIHFSETTNTSFCIIKKI